jgi:UDP-N-acetylmuramyl pentapeptide phosphotransferase/UDP-N-acetylglucosamine-1-phosphate transferase
LLQLAAAGHLAAALLLSLYYLADATITLVQRIARAETIWQAHRTHFYQRATDRGLSVTNVVARVFVVNLLLAGLAFITVAAQNMGISLAMLGVGGAIVLWVLATFASGKERRE